MLARQWAVFCLLLAGLSPAWAHDDGSPHHGPAIPELVVYLENASAQSPALLKFMRQELAGLMKQAGYHLAFHEMHDGEISGADFVSVVAFSGTCSIPAGYRSDEDRTPVSPVLATTAVTDGRVLPFSAVNCTALTRLLQSALLQSPGAQRNFLYGRALARVIAHELYHVLAHTTGHTGSGVAQRSLSPAELLGETRPAARFSLP
jgi:hypothetical protein